MEFKRISEDELKERLKVFKKEISAKGNIPENLNEIILLRYLKFFNGNVEKSLKRLIGSMEVRKSYPHIFFNRDTNDPLLGQLSDQVEMVLLPKLTPENNRIIVTRLIDFSTDNLPEMDETLRISSMIFDIAAITPENNGSLADGEVLIYDLNGLTAKHFTKLSFSSLRGFFRYMSEAHLMRIREIHLINCSSLVDKLVMLIRPFVGKAMQIMHFHQPDSTTLFDFVPMDVIPVELGGTDESIIKSKIYWIKKTEEHREFIINDEQWKFTDARSDEDEEENIEDNFSYMGFC
ncbi:hypothetical protein PVAND_009984 [Polypedilum vanderplanki]|uniref:CRAL-TRIO domain-containing protein n=1 Tax=Polypedilum vanderplanki TaxID=319348 RepID=A0A9J6CEG1_POLVA|nr:hypothetical protein PVAND_009984 [Polypedilum vanderplanki]